MNSITKDILGAITRSVGGKFVLPGAISGLIGVYGAAQHKLNWLPPMSVATITMLVLTPPLLTLLVGLIGRVVSLERKLKPRIDLGLDSANGGVSTYPTTSGIMSKWAQLIVTATDGSLVDCQVLVTSVYRILDGATDEMIEQAPVSCTWSHTSQSTCTVAPDISQYVNLFGILDGDNSVLVQLNPARVRLSTEIQMPGKYRINVSATAKDAPTERKSYIFSWGGNFNEFTLTELN